MSSPEQFSPEQLAGWACHALGPHLEALLDMPRPVEESPNATGRPLPGAAVKLWLCLMGPESEASYSADIRSTARQLVESKEGGAAMQRRLFVDIQLTLERSPRLCVEVDALKASMLKPQL